MVSIGPRLPAGRPLRGQKPWDLDNPMSRVPGNIPQGVLKSKWADFRQEKIPPKLIEDGILSLGHFYVYGHSGREREVRESLYHLGRRVKDIDDALVYAHLELLARVFVDEGRT